MRRRIGKVKVYFSDYFGISPDVLETYDAFNISLINDLPLFIDPFLLFTSKKIEYKKLHENMIDYLRFLRDKSVEGVIEDGGLNAWFTFPEIKQNWLGFSQFGNKGSGLGIDFARALNRNLNILFKGFGTEKITHSSHIEKLCLIGSGVGRDNISDFTANLIKEYLLNYTQEFAQMYIKTNLRKQFRIPKVRFNKDTETWEPEEFELPILGEDYVILTPKDILTMDDVWINRSDMVKDYKRIIYSVPDNQLRFQFNNFITNQLRKQPRKPSLKEKNEVAFSLYREFPELIDYYIRFKEDHGENAITQSKKVVLESQNFYIDGIKEFVERLNQATSFYRRVGNTYDEAKERVLYLKDIIENKGGHHIFYKKGKPISTESDLQILFRLTWYGSNSDVSREVNDGRGPVDFKISKGAQDKTLVEFKLASNTKLVMNLQHQTEIYSKASDTERVIKVIIYFTQQQLNKVKKILKDLKMQDSQDVILIDARNDNKPSGSVASEKTLLGNTNEKLDFNFDIPDNNIDESEFDFGCLDYYD